MKYMRLPKIILGFFVTTLMLVGFIAAPVGAQAANTNAAQGLQISPTLVNLNAAPGKSYNITLNVLNVTGSDLVYTPSVEDFNAAGETGSPHIFIDNSLTSATSIRTWLSVVPPFTLKGKQTKVITAQISIPNNAEPGGHYGALLFSGTAPQLKSTGVGLSASGGVLILIRVAGDIIEEANLASFYSAQPGGSQSSFFEYGPIGFVTRIKNVGNIHVKPSGSIEVHDMFGGLVTTIAVNSDQSNVLPNSIRRFDSQFNKSWMIGRYTADLTLAYGTTGQAITNTISFWVIPYRLILVILLILVTVIYILRRMIKVYNKRIIEKAKNENKNNKHSKGKS